MKFLCVRAAIATFYQCPDWSGLATELILVTIRFCGQTSKLQAQPLLKLLVGKQTVGYFDRSAKSVKRDTSENFS